MKRYSVREISAGNVIDDFDTIKDCKTAIKDYIQKDLDEFNYDVNYSGKDDAIEEWKSERLTKDNPTVDETKADIEKGNYEIYDNLKEEIIFNPDFDITKDIVDNSKQNQELMKIKDELLKGNTIHIFKENSNYTPADFKIERNSEDNNMNVLFKSKEISGNDWIPHPSMNFQTVFDHFQNMLNEGFECQIIKEKENEKMRKEFKMYNDLTKEQKSCLNSLSLINNFEVQNDPDTNFGKIYSASQENKELIFDKAEEAWLKSDDNSLGKVADNFVDAFNKGLTIEKLEQMSKWNLVDLGEGINPENYESEEDEDER